MCVWAWCIRLISYWWEGLAEAPPTTCALDDRQPLCTLSGSLMDGRETPRLLAFSLTSFLLLLSKGLVLSDARQCKY